jgi:hypothetical protein
LVGSAIHGALVRALLPSGPMDEDAFRDWLERYERTWRSRGTAELAELFAPDATYRHSPYAEPLTSLEEIARDWEEQRDGPDETFTMAAEVLAVNAAHPNGPLGVARVLVRYGGDAGGQEYRDLWLVHFDAAGRALEFEEWPFWPGQGWQPGP